ncbi:hypothetical protein BconGalA64_00410 [Burkholderia contaminans]|nr:hypothetical protein BconGalA64_00410 [Burkholderia contaminans]
MRFKNALKGRLVEQVQLGDVFRRQREQFCTGALRVPYGGEQRQRRFASQAGGNRTAEQAGRADEEDSGTAGWRNLVWHEVAIDHGNEGIIGPIG